MHLQPINPLLRKVGFDFFHPFKSPARVPENKIKWGIGLAHNPWMVVARSAPCTLSTLHGSIRHTITTSQPPHVTGTGPGRQGCDDTECLAESRIETLSLSFPDFAKTTVQSKGKTRSSATNTTSSSSPSSRTVDPFLAAVSRPHDAACYCSYPEICPVSGPEVPLLISSSN